MIYYIGINYLSRALNKMYKFTEKTKVLYPAEIFDELGCLLSGELATIIAETNSGKTTFAVDMIERNAERGIEGLYINLEFPIETTRLSKWLWVHGKEKSDLGGGLTDYEKKDLEDYVNEKLNKVKYFNKQGGIELSELIKIISSNALLGTKLFVVDTFSMIDGNNGDKARANQNRCMTELQELAQRLDIVIILLHHMNKKKEFAGSQKIMDLSQVVLVIEKFDEGESSECRVYRVAKDKYVSNRELYIRYQGGKYEQVKGADDIGYPKPF